MRFFIDCERDMIRKRNSLGLDNGRGFDVRQRSEGEGDDGETNRLAQARATEGKSKRGKT